jgi:hypothetical protein
MDISIFYDKSSRNNNDATNKAREIILLGLNENQSECINVVNLKNEWAKALRCIVTIQYTHIKIERKAGRSNNYDFDATYYNGETQVETRKIEFKYNAKTIHKLPQFLSLQSRFPVLDTPYELFYYRNYLDLYLALDSSITEPKPSEEVYLNTVSTINYDKLPFYRQLKDKEHVNKTAKTALVNRSIKEYLEQNKDKINLQEIRKKIEETQKDKYYFLWHEGKFYVESFTKIVQLEFETIKNSNTIVLSTNNEIYSLLLRWRNHKGVLNPAWQLSVKRKNLTNHLSPSH